MLPVIPLVWAFLRGRAILWAKRNVAPIILVSALVAASGFAVVKHKGWVNDFRNEVRNEIIDQVRAEDAKRATEIRNRVDAVGPRPAPDRLHPLAGDSRGYRD